MMRIDLIFGAILVASCAFAQSAAGNASLDGQVVNLSTGAPISRAAVVLVIDMGRTLSARPSFPDVETDEQGRFAFRNLGPGIYWRTRGRSPRFRGARPRGPEVQAGRRGERPQIAPPPIASRRTSSRMESM